MPHPNDSFGISVRDADGKEPLPICRRTRDWLIEHYQAAAIIVLRFFSDAPPVNPTYKSEEPPFSQRLMSHHHRHSTLMTGGSGL